LKEGFCSDLKEDQERNHTKNGMCPYFYKSFTLINLLPKELLDEEKGKVSKDMSECLQLDNTHRFKQITWEDFLSEIGKWNVITDTNFWKYLANKIPSLNFP
jgi:hypothetical protein